MSDFSDQSGEAPLLGNDVVGAAMRRIDDLLVFRRDKRRRYHGIKREPVFLELSGHVGPGFIGDVGVVRMMIVVGLIVLGVSRPIAAMMRRGVGHNDDDALGLRPKREAGGVREG